MNQADRPDPELDLRPFAIALYVFGGLLAVVLAWLFVVLFVGIFG